MKIKFLTVVFIFLTQISFAQRLKKGTLFGVHTISVELKPGVTMDEFKTFFVSKVIPEYEKHWIGLHGYMMQSFKDSNSLAIVWQFESVQARNKYFTADGKSNDLEKSNQEKVKPIEKELEKYGTYTVHYKDTDDWVVQ